ncbi:MAG: methyl-accepting chemotaxis protein [Selenomonadaceae bacterium]|nr:methyl-accepting chemotaxis protein [Selenomonadaceae bacterium]
MNQSETIAQLFHDRLRCVSAIIVGVVVIVMGNLYLFTSYTGVVNDAGIVRGGDQRVVKQVLAGADESKAMAAVDGKLQSIGQRMHLGSFPGERDAVDQYWQQTLKPAIVQYKQDGEAAPLLEASETFFNKTNKMVEAAQTMVDIMAVCLYVLLAAFVVVTLLALYRGIYQTFRERVVDPLHALEDNVNSIVRGNLSQRFDYGRADEIGAVYELLRSMSKALQGYVQDIDKNLSLMADGDLVTATTTDYVGDFKPIQENLQHIRETMCTAMESIGKMAEDVAVSSGEVSKVSQSLAEGAVSQTESVQTLQASINEVIGLNTTVDNCVADAKEAAHHTRESVAASQQEVHRVVDAMQDISKASEEIRGILGTLDGITSQTSLLALNASIEAARAGEAGRGFAVVADEVRKLSDESAKNTQEISSLINRALAAIESGIQVVDDAENSMNHITGNTSKVRDIIEQLQGESQKQRENLSHVGEQTNKILAVVTDNSAVSEECAASSNELSRYSDALKENVSKFRTK